MAKRIIHVFSACRFASSSPIDMVGIGNGTPGYYKRLHLHHSHQDPDPEPNIRVSGYSSLYPGIRITRISDYPSIRVSESEASHPLNSNNPDIRIFALSES